MSQDAVKKPDMCRCGEAPETVEPHPCPNDAVIACCCCEMCKENCRRYAIDPFFMSRGDKD